MAICSSCSNGTSCDTCLASGTNPALDCTCPSIFYNDSNGICQECLPGCSSCSNGSSCDSCTESDKNLALGCTCPAIFYSDTNGVC